MEESKALTLSINQKKPKIFGKPSKSAASSVRKEELPSSVSKTASLTPKKKTASTTSNTPVNSNSLKKESKNKYSNSVNEDLDNSYDSEDFDTKPTPKKSTTNSTKESPLNSDRLSVKSTSSKKSSTSQKQNQLTSSNKKSDQKELESDHISTPVKTKNEDQFYERAGSVSSKKSTSSIKKPQLSLKLSPNPTNQPSEKPANSNSVPSSKSTKKPENNNNDNKAQTLKLRKNSPPRPPSSNKSKGKNFDSFNSEDESYDYYSPSKSPERQKTNDTQEDSNPITKDILPLINSLFDNKDEDVINGRKIGNVADSLEEWQKNIVSKVSPIEESQTQFWYKSLIELFKQQNLYISDNSNNESNNDEANSPKLSYLDEIISKSRNVLRSHRFPFHGEYGHRFKFVVTGPNSSGKTTYLSLLSQQLLFELIACGDWKRTFIFPVNFATLAPIAHDLGVLFVEMSKLTIRALCTQRPLLLKHCDSLLESFEAVVNGKPSVSRGFQLDDDYRMIAPQLQKFLDVCYECYHDKQAMTAFITNACLLPFFMANIFGGFSNIIVIGDHFDLIDITKTATRPFEESPDNVFLVEIFKSLLIQCSFVLGSKYDVAMNEVLTSLDMDNNSFSLGIEFLATFDIIPRNDEEEEEEDGEKLTFNVSFDGATDSFAINRDTFDGCPAFLAKFDEIVEIAQKIEKGEKQEDEKMSRKSSEADEDENIDVEEEKLKLVIKTDQLLKLTMIEKDGAAYNMHVKDVTFGQKKNNQKKQK